MADNKRGRGDRDENQENPNECKSAKAIKLLREVTSLLSEGDSVFMDLDFVSVRKHAKKKLDQYPAILT